MTTTDKIEQLPDGTGELAYFIFDEYPRYQSTGLNVRDLKALVSELDRKTRALEEAQKVIEHCELNHHRHSGRARKWLEENAE